MKAKIRVGIVSVAMLAGGSLFEEELAWGDDSESTAAEKGGTRVPAALMSIDGEAASEPLLPAAVAPVELAPAGGSGSFEGASGHGGATKAAEPEYEDVGFGRCSPEDAKRALREFFEGYESYEKKNQLAKLQPGENSLYLTRMRDFLKGNPSLSSSAWNAGAATFEMFNILPVPTEDKVKLGEIDALIQKKLVGTPYEKKNAKPEVKRPQ